MTSTLPRPSIRRVALAIVTLAAALLVVAAAQLAARATHDIVTLSGTLAADDFLVAVDERDTSQLLLCAETCFTRARSEVGAIIVDGFDGDDSLTVNHGSAFVTNTDGDLGITFNAGTGSDRVTVCTEDALAACSAALTTTLAPGAAPAERVLTQSAGTGGSMTLTAVDVAEIRDHALGTIVVRGGETADQITYREATGSDGTGEIAVNTAAAYRFEGKESVTVDSGAGADEVGIVEAAGLASSTTTCAPQDAPAAPVCVVADSATDDVVSVRGTATSAETVSLTPRAAGAASLTGLAAVDAVDLAGVDHVAMALQSSEDSLAATTTSHADVVRATITTSGVTLAGDAATDATAFPLPALDIAGDGTAPLDVALSSPGGSARFEVTATAGDDTVAIGPTHDGDDELPGARCGAVSTTCLEVTPEGLQGVRFTLDGVDQHLLEAGDGDDMLAAAGSLPAPVTWRGGEGVDGAKVLGTGPALSVDLATNAVQQEGGAAITATATERLAIDAAGASVTTTGTPAGDEITVEPDTAESATVVLAGHQASLRLESVGGVNVLDTAGGDDTVTVNGTTAGDRFAAGRTADLSVQVGSLLPVRISASERAVLTGLAGDDRFDITGDGGPATLTVDGGADAGADTLTFAGATTDVTVSVDDDLGTGQLDADGPPVGFQGLERVDLEGDGDDVLTVRGSDAADRLTQEGNTVTVGRTTSVTFARFPDLTVAGGPAGDDVWLAPATTTGVAQLTAAGDAGTDALTVRGTALSEQVGYQPSAADAGTVTVGAEAPVTFTGIEDTRFDGATTPPSGDTLVVATPDHDGTLTLEPGSTFDSGTVRFLDVAGASTTAAPLSFGGIGGGEVRFAGGQAGPVDRVLLTGQPDDDVVTVQTRSTAAGSEAVVTIDQQVPVAVPGAHTLVLDARDGADTFHVPTDHPVPGQAAPGIEVRAGGPDSGDRLELTAGDGELVVDVAGNTVSEAGHAGTSYTGVEQIGLDAAGNPLRVAGGPDPDAVTWQPTGPAGGTITVPGAPALQLRSVGPLSIDPGDGADEVSVELRSVPDAVTVSRAATTRVAVEGLQPVSLVPSVESLTVATADGADRVHVVGAGGPGTLAVDGGGPTAAGDELVLHSPDVTVSYATDPTQGRLDSAGGAVLFTAVETLDVQGDGTGALVVNGTDGAESLTIGETSSPRIRVDEAAAVTYGGYPAVTLAGHGGDDQVVVGYTGLGQISSLGIIGGPGNGDGVDVVDTTGTTRTFTVRPETATTGTVDASDQETTLTMDAVEAVDLDGRGGDDQVKLVTPAGAQDVQVTPGDTGDDGRFRVASLLPIGFAQIGVDGQLTVVDAEDTRTDTVVLEGTPGSDAVTVAGGSGEVRRAGWVPMLPLGAIDLALHGGDGDDDVTASGPLPYAVTTVEGGSPDLGDGLSLQGPAGDVRVDLAAGTVTGYGGTIRFPGVVDLHTDVGGADLTQAGTARDDALCYDPMAPRDGRLYIVGAPGGGTESSTCLPDQRGTNVLHTFVDVAHLTLDPAAGSDEVIVNGTTSRDLISVHAQAPETGVTIHPEPESGSTFRLPVHVVVATTESLVAAADNGSDSFEVVTYDSSAPLITLHGEEPSTMQIADDLVVRDGTGAAHLHDTNSQTKGSGTVTAEYRKGSGAVIRLDYIGIENVTLDRDPKAGE